jgi:hypothetical protein
MNQDIEKILSMPPDDFERVLYRTERWLELLERTIQYSAEVSATLDKSYDLLLVGLAHCQDDDDDRDTDTTATTAKARALVKQFRGFRDTDTGELLTHIVGELHTLHALHKGRMP